MCISVTLCTQTRLSIDAHCNLHCVVGVKYSPTAVEWLLDQKSATAMLFVVVTMNTEVRSSEKNSKGDAPAQCMRMRSDLTNSAPFQA